MVSSGIFFIILLSNIASGLFIPRQCVEVRTEMCQKLDPKNYKWTSFPNFLNQTSYEQVNGEIAQYQPLVAEQCSEDMPMFLCSVYVPICREGVKMKIPPCRSLCESARKGCGPLLDLATITWPESLRCDQFPVDDGKTLCITPKKKTNNVPDVKPVLPSKKRSHHKASVSFKRKFQNKAGSQLVLSCGANEKISIRKIRFFPHHTSKCCPSSGINYVAKKCKGKQNCFISIDEVTKASNCVNTVRIVSTKYRCVNVNETDRGHRSKKCAHNS